ncbi:MAG: hypothetical protein EHM91_09355 [Planctomycetota bacterium]|nr:MAG: hypothetical protein EHM91_09355 [Planctomycetota bacterium]
MTFARRVFLTTGLYGVIVIAPQFFLERSVTPAVTHPEQYYGFLGAVLAWNIAYLVMAGDPARYRPLMLVGSLGKVLFSAFLTVLWFQGRVPSFLLAFAAIDLGIVTLYIEAWRRTAPVAEPAKDSDVTVLDFRRTLEHSRN